MASNRNNKQPNIYYIKYAQEHLIIDEDSEGLFCEVLSESNPDKTYRVHVDDSLVVPVASHCTCPHFENCHTCKHCEQIVNPFWRRIYKSNVEKLQAKQEVVETLVEAAQVEEVVPPVAMELPEELQGYRKTVKVGKPGSVELAGKGNLNGAQQSSGFWGSLPSRKAS